MRKEYDFSNAKRAKDIPALARLRAETRGKTRITIMLDNDVLAAFRTRGDEEGTGYQTLINQALHEHVEGKRIDEVSLRRIVREEIRARDRRAG